MGTWDRDVEREHGMGTGMQDGDVGRDGDRDGDVGWTCGTGMWNGDVGLECEMGTWDGDKGM